MRNLKDLVGKTLKRHTYFYIDEFTLARLVYCCLVYDILLSDDNIRFITNNGFLDTSVKLKYIHDSQDFYYNYINNE